MIGKKRRRAILTPPDLFSLEYASSLGRFACADDIIPSSSVSSSRQMWQILDLQSNHIDISMFVVVQFPSPYSFPHSFRISFKKSLTDCSMRLNADNFYTETVRARGAVRVHIIRWQNFCLKISSMLWPFTPSLRAINV